MTRSLGVETEDATAALQRYGHERVLEALAAASPADRDRLVGQLAAWDLAEIDAAFRRRPGPGPAGLAPAPVVRLAECGGDERTRTAARERGEAALAAGRVAALVVAGGEGTRLGFAGPKGAFPIGPVTRRSLFELQAQKLRGLRRRYGRSVPWYVMTSRATDRATRALFAAESFFGLSPGEVFFLTQRDAPCLDFSGQLLLAGPAVLATNPDGHGGVLAALRDAGVFPALRGRGIESVFFYQVDNPLARLCDPVLVGFQQGAEVASKVVEKGAPDDRLGTLATRGGRTAVIEYTEIREPERSLRSADGGLTYWAGTIGIHCFSRAFLERCAPRAEAILPYHLSPKRIATPGVPAEPNGIKLERFVFDLLPHAERVVAVEARREEEFAPVKNASGGQSPQTARAALTMCYRRWLEAAGLEVPAGARIEIDHSWADGPDEVRAHGLASVGQAPDEIAIEMGGTA